MIKKRSLVLSCFLSLLYPGVGHIYAGNLRKGLYLIGILFGVILLGGIAGIFSTFYGILALTVFMIGFYIYVIISSIILAYRNNEYHIKRYNRWYWYIAIIILFTILLNILFSFRASVLGYETYRITAGSMAPTLQVNDFITVNTRYSEPRVGDVIAFISPDNPATPLVKRVAALSNDTISIKNGSVIRNGETVIELSVPASERQRQYSISMREQRVPESHLFLLGDWRDNSKDSRYWGSVPITNLIGKVTYIWYSDDTSRIGMKVK